MRPLIALALLLLAGTAGAQTTASPPCALDVMADFPVTFIDGDPTVTVTIDGKPMHMVVDSGSDVSYLSPHAYDVLNIHDTFDKGEYTVTGLGGTAHLDLFVVEDMLFGNVHLHNEALGVFPDDVPISKGKQAEDGVIGYDILELFDEGLDLPHNRITFYKPDNCTVNATPWQGNFDTETFTRPEDSTPVFPITINNQTLQFELDTGSDSTLVFQHSLNLAGISPEATQPT